MEDEYNLNTSELVWKTQWESSKQNQLDAIQYIHRIITAHNCQQFISSKIHLQLQVPKDQLEVDELFAITQAKLQLYLKIVEICQYKHQFMQISNFIQDLLQFPTLHENLLFIYVQILSNILEITLTLQKPHLYILIKHTSLLIQLSQQHYYGFNQQNIQQYIYKQQNEKDDIAFTTVAINKQKYKIPTQLILSGPKYQFAQILKYISLTTSQELFSVSLRLISSLYLEILQNTDNYPHSFHQIMREIIQILLYDRRKNIELFVQIEKKHFQIQALLPTQQLLVRKQEFIIKSVGNSHINSIFAEEISKYSSSYYYQNVEYQQWLAQQHNVPFISISEDNSTNQFEINKLLINQLDKHALFSMGSLFVNYVEIKALNEPYNNFNVIINILKNLSNRQLDQQYVLKAFQAYFKMMKQIYYKCGINIPSNQNNATNRSQYYQEYLLFTVPINTLNQQNLSHAKENKYLLQLYNSLKSMNKKQNQQDKINTSLSTQDDVSEKQRNMILVLIENIKFIKFLLDVGYITSFNVLIMVQKQLILPQNVNDAAYRKVYEDVFGIIKRNDLLTQQLLLLSGHPFRSLIAQITLNLLEIQNIEAELFRLPQTTKLSREKVEDYFKIFKSSTSQEEFLFYKDSLPAIALWTRFDDFTWFFRLASGGCLQFPSNFICKEDNAAQNLVSLFFKVICSENGEESIEAFAIQVRSILGAFLRQFKTSIQQIFVQTLGKEYIVLGNETIMENVTFLTQMLQELHKIYILQQNNIKLPQNQQQQLENLFQVIINVTSLNLQRTYNVDSIVDDYKYINITDNKQQLNQVVQFLNFLTIEKPQEAFEYFIKQSSNIYPNIAIDEQLYEEKNFKELYKQLKRQLRDFINENEIVSNNKLQQLIINILNTFPVKLNIQKYVGQNIQLIISLKTFIFSQYEMNKFDQLIHMLTLILQSQFEDSLELYVNLLDSSQMQLNQQDQQSYLLFGLQQYDGNYIPKLTLLNTNQDDLQLELQEIFELQQNFHHQYLGLLADVKQAMRQQNYATSQILPYYGHTWFEFILTYIQNNVVMKQQTFSLFNQLDAKQPKVQKIYLQQQQCYQVYSNQEVEILTLKDIQLSMLNFKQSEIQTQIIDSVLLELYLTIYNLNKIIFDTQTFKLLLIVHRLGYHQLIEQLLSVKDNHQIVGSISRFCMVKQASLYSFFFSTFNIMQNANPYEFDIIIKFIEYLNQNQTLLYDRQSIIQYLKCNTLDDFKKLIYKFVHLQINILNQTDEDKIKLFNGRKYTSSQICRILINNAANEQNKIVLWGSEYNFMLISQLWSTYC